MCDDVGTKAAPVAPFTGAWIETEYLMDMAVDDAVAPFTGAWIETFFALLFRGLESSLPSRERGLKPRPSLPSSTPAPVAPFTGAWIETESVDDRGARARSLPSRERGLKHHSSPTRHRGW